MDEPYPLRRSPVGIGDVDGNRERFASRRTFGPADLDAIGRLVQAADETVPVREAFTRRNDWPERFLTIRHDMDHDVENAMRFAEWEANRGIRSTYFVLHNDWYWGPDPARPSALVLNALEAIASMGHEIGLHNQAISFGLRRDLEPLLVLDRALGALRRHGFDIVGSVAHGEPTAREVGFVNSELFTDCPRPKLGAPDRQVVWTDDAGRAHFTRLHPIPMANFGLEYEANYIGHSRYLSDTGGRWHRPFAEEEEHFTREGAFLQLLIHPVWWAFRGEALREMAARVPAATPAEVSVDPDAAVAADPAAGEVRASAQGGGAPSSKRLNSVPYAESRQRPRALKILVRGDCCSRRAIEFNRDLFGGSPVQVRDEKARTDFFVEHPIVGSPTPEDISSYLDLDRMGKSLRHYASHQADRTTMEISDADLLVMDNYSDMNFAAWRHRERGWKMWIHPAYLIDQDAFNRDFEKMDRLSLDESLEHHRRLIDLYRERNGPIPVLYFHQPVAYYKKLEIERGEFRNLGPELERTVPDVFAVDIADEDLEPDDMGSCGPGQTLHFTGPTYRTMIQSALARGLARWVE